MKNYLKITTLFLFIGVLFSCEEDKVMFGSSTDMVKFERASVDFPLNIGEDNVLEVAVSVTGVSDASRTFSITIDEESTTALSADYTIESSTLVIPANEYIAKIRIHGFADDFEQGTSKLLRFSLNPIDGLQIDPNNKTFSVNMYLVCPTEDDLSGVHDYTLYDVFLGDGAGAGTAYPTFSSSGTVSFSLPAGFTVEQGTYVNSDITFGLFPAAGYDPPARRIQWVCDRIDVLQPDQYGDTYTYTITSVVGNVMELTFVNTWGDSGHVTLYREGGLDWPAAFQD